MIIIQTNRFKKSYKRLHKNQLTDVNKAIEAVIADVNIGERKKGDLSSLRVHKFKTCGQLTLLGYMVNTNSEIVLTFIDIGSHENFYRDLKK